MGSQKLRAIIRIITSKGFVIFTVRRDDRITYSSSINSDLAEAITLAIALKQSYNELTETIEETATENGQLNNLIALREAVERLNNGRD